MIIPKLYDRIVHTSPALFFHLLDQIVHDTWIALTIMILAPHAQLIIWFRLQYRQGRSLTNKLVKAIFAPLPLPHLLLVQAWMNSPCSRPTRTSGIRHLILNFAVNLNNDLCILHRIFFLLQFATAQFGYFGRVSHCFLLERHLILNKSTVLVHEVLRLHITALLVLVFAKGLGR